MLSHEVVELFPATAVAPDTLAEVARLLEVPAPSIDAAAAEAMRRILVEQARRKKRLKHGGERQRADAGELNLVAAAPEDEVLSVHEALDGLAAVDAQAAQVVKLHFFAGMTLEDVASVLEISARTAYRDWAFARAWLAKRLDGPEKETP